MTERKIDQDKALEFILSGNSMFTLKSIKTGNRFTYRVRSSQRNPNNFFVGVLTGNDNSKDYSPMLYLSIVDGIPSIMTSKKSWIKEDSPSCIAFKYVFMNLLIRKKMDNLEIWHIGRCCRCGRLLTVPESVESGIGPECATREKIASL